MDDQLLESSISTEICLKSLPNTILLFFFFRFLTENISLSLASVILLSQANFPQNFQIFFLELMVSTTLQITIRTAEVVNTFVIFLKLLTSIRLLWRIEFQPVQILVDKIRLHKLQNVTSIFFDK